MISGLCGWIENDGVDAVMTILPRETADKLDSLVNMLPKIAHMQPNFPIGDIKITIEKASPEEFTKRLRNLHEKVGG